jgi:hypothetical protein
MGEGARMTPAEQEYIRKQAHILMRAAQERDARERAAKCGSLATFDGFENALAALIVEKFE